MYLASDTNNISYIPQMSNQLAGGLIAGGGALCIYGYRKLSNADKFGEKLNAGGYIAFGLGLATLGTLGTISNIWKSAHPSTSENYFPSIPADPISVSTVYPNPHLMPVETCNTVFQAGISPEEMRIYSAEINELDKYIPPMQEGIHYNNVKGAMDSGYLYCWATLTDLGKQLIGKDSLRVHTASIPGTAYAKINMY